MLPSTVKKPLLEIWGQKVASKMFEGPSKLSKDSRTELVSIIEEIKSANCHHVFLLKPNALKIISSLPYPLGYACAIGSISKDIVDLTKPILVIGSGGKSLTKLESMLSMRKHIRLPYLQQRGFISKLDQLSGAYYRTYAVKGSSDARKLYLMNGQYDIVLCSDQVFEHLPDHSFSLVVVADGSKCLDEAGIRAKFESDCKVLVLTHNQDRLPAKHTRPKSARFAKPNLVENSKVISKERIWPFLSAHQREAMDKVMERLSDGSSKRVPIEINTGYNHGTQIILATLPYLMGRAAKTSTSGIDLNKPILMISANDVTWNLLKQAMRVNNRSFLVKAGLMTQQEFDRGLHYDSHIIEDSFDLCTYSKDVFSQNVVLARQEMLLCRGKKSRKCLEVSSFSAVVMIKSISDDVKFEREILHICTEIPLAFMRIKGHQNMEIDVPSMISTVQHFGAESITPKLTKHCKYMACEFLLGLNSVLNVDQQQFLTSLIEWIAGREKLVTVNTRIGYDKATAALQCLPILLEWVKKNNLSPTPNIEKFEKPLLVVSDDDITLLEISSSTSIHHPNAFTKNKCRHCKFSCHQFSESTGVADVKKYKNSHIFLSNTENLKNLLDIYFPIVIAYSKGHLSPETMRLVNEKFGKNSRVIFFETFPSIIGETPATSNNREEEIAPNDAAAVVCTDMEDDAMENGAQNAASNIRMQEPIDHKNMHSNSFALESLYFNSCPPTHEEAIISDFITKDQQSEAKAEITNLESVGIVPAFTNTHQIRNLDDNYSLKNKEIFISREHKPDVNPPENNCAREVNETDRNASFYNEGCPKDNFIECFHDNKTETGCLPQVSTLNNTSINLVPRPHSPYLEMNENHLKDNPIAQYSLSNSASIESIQPLAAQTSSYQELQCMDSKNHTESDASTSHEYLHPLPTNISLRPHNHMEFHHERNIVKIEDISNLETIYLEPNLNINESNINAKHMNGRGSIYLDPMLDNKGSKNGNITNIKHTSSIETIYLEPNLDSQHSSKNTNTSIKHARKSIYLEPNLDSQHSSKNINTSITHTSSIETIYLEPSLDTQHSFKNTNNSIKLTRESIYPEPSLDRQHNINITHSSSIETIYLEPSLDTQHSSKNTNTSIKLTRESIYPEPSLDSQHNINITHSSSIETIYLEPSLDTKHCSKNTNTSIKHTSSPDITHMEQSPHTVYQNTNLKHCDSLEIIYL